MEEHISQVTLWFNHLFGPLALRLFHAVHVQPADYENPIPEYIVMSLIVFALCTVLALILRSRLSVERPGGMQQVAEMLLTNPLGFGIKDLLEENVGHGGEKFIPFVGAISVFILFSNLLGVIPAFSSPTGGAMPIVPLGCAILTFLYFNWQGIRHHGPVGYVKTFTGPVWWLAWLIGPVEMISATARIWEFFRWPFRFCSSACTFLFRSFRPTCLPCCRPSIWDRPWPKSTELRFCRLA